jgi:hypothetical protein
MYQIEPGQIVATPGAIDALKVATESGVDLLMRHLNGDWGELDEEDVQTQRDSFVNGFSEDRIMSVFTLSTGEKLWIITEWDRSVTTYLLPEEY